MPKSVTGNIYGNFLLRSASILVCNHIPRPDGSDPLTVR